MTRPEPSPQTSIGHGRHGSVWPILTAIGGVVLLLDALIPFLVPLGLVFVVGTVWGWVREDARTLHPVAPLRSDR